MRKSRGFTGTTAMHRLAAVAAAGLLLAGLSSCGGSGSVAGREGADLGATPVPTGPPIRAAGPLQSELVKGTGPSPKMTKYELQDLGQLAKQTGEDVAVLKARHRGNTQFGVLANRISFDYQEIWVSSGVAKDGDPGDHWLVFTKRPPAQVFTKLKQLGTDTNVMFGAPATSREIRRLSLAVLTSLTAHAGVFSSAGTGSDPYGASASVSYSLEPSARLGPGELDRYKAEALAAGAARFKDGTMPVLLEFVEGPPGARDRLDKQASVSPSPGGG